MTMSGRVALLTGAAGNLGQAVAQAFAAQGARLVLLDLDAEKVCARNTQLSTEFLPLGADLTDAAAVLAAVSQAQAHFGRIDAVCNIAGGFAMGPAVHETPMADWQRMLDLNVGTMLNTVQAVTPLMLAAGAGQIVNVGAYAAQSGVGQMGAYCASKSAVMRLTESMAEELRAQGINVNCVLPTIIDTPPNRAAMPDADPADWVSPDDLAQVILFLCSPAARAVHGACLPVRGLS